MTLSMPRGTILLAAATLVVTALVGAYLGYNRAATAPGGGSADSVSVTPTVAAKTASAIPDSSAAPIPDEAYIRKLAHDEAEQILHPPKKAIKTVSDASDSSDDTTDDTADPGPTTPPSPQRVSPAPSPPPAAPAAPPPPAGLY